MNRLKHKITEKIKVTLQDLAFSIMRFGDLSCSDSATQLLALS